jgi:hypothetical protein
MKFRGLLLAAGALALLSGLVYWSNKAEKDKEGKPAADAPPKVLEIPTDQVQKVEIVKGGQTTAVAKGGDGKWELTAPRQFRADQDAVSSLVNSFNSLSSDRVIEEKAGDLSGYGLAKPAIAVTITRKDGKVSKLLLGDDTPTSGSVFAKLDADARVFTLASFNKSSLDKTFKDLQDKRLLTFDSDKITRIELAVKGKSVEFGKNSNNEWQILKPKTTRADGGNVEELIRKLKDAKMDPLVNEADAKKAVTEFAAAAVAGVAKITDASGSHQLEVRKAKDNTYYVKGSAVEGVFKGTSDLGDGLSKEVDTYRQKKLFEFGWNDPNKIEITDAGKTRAFAKSGDKWKEGNKDMDSTSVQALVDKLRDLAAASFPESGYTAPVFTAVVTSNDGKRTEKVLLSKSGEKYFAIRENEPPVYEIDKKAFEELQRAAADVKEPASPKKDEKKDSHKK